MKSSLETLSGIGYKLHVMVITMNGASDIYGDSMFVKINTSKQEPVLQEKNNTVCQHTVCESVAMGESSMAHIDGNANPADLLMNDFCRNKEKVIQ